MHSPDNSSPERINFEPHPIAMEQARFIDLLAPEYEEMWDEFLDVVEPDVFFGTWGSGIDIREGRNYKKTSTLADIYSDDSAPRVFRDRAMALVFNSSIHRKSDRFKEYTEGSPDKVAAYTSWLREAIDYQARLEALIVEPNPYIKHDLIRKNRIIDPKLVMQEVRRLFASSLIDEEEFEDFLMKVDLEQAEPRVEYVYHGDDETREIIYGRDRFLVISYILEKFSNRTDEATALQHWAFNQFNVWLDAQFQGRQADLPPWLNTEGERQLAGVKLCRKLCRRLYKANKEGEELFFNWGDLLPAIEYSGALLFRQGAVYDRTEEIKGEWRRSFGLYHLENIVKQPEGELVKGPLLRYFLEARESTVRELNDIVDWEIINMEIRSDPRSSSLMDVIYGEAFLEGREIGILDALAEGVQDPNVLQGIEKEKSLLLKLEKWREEIRIYQDEESENRRSREEAVGAERRLEKEAEKEDSRGRLSDAVSLLKDAS